MARVIPEVWLHPTRLIIVTYLVVAGIGSGLLLLPVATPPGVSGASIDTAILTATSALTVTGLAAVDTATSWSAFGKVVILVLIQLGGFGITTFASVFAVLVFRRLGLRARLATQLEQNAPASGDLRGLVGRIAIFYVVAEVIGALILAVGFGAAGASGPLDALWSGVFHSVSAFNNAGFSIYSDNLVGFVGNPVVLFTIMALIVIGGIGFPVVLELTRVGLRYRAWSIHTRLTVGTTAVLLAVGFIAFAAFEWNNVATLGGLDGPAERLLNASFASVTPRTAGFNTINYGDASPASQFLTIILMLIGGGSASAAGGIKVTTFALLAFVILAELRSDREVNTFGRRISESTQRQAVAVALLGVGSIAIGTLALAATSPDLAIGALLFETVSAVGTVGLSTGITPDLEPASRIIISVLMLLGRLGPVTFGTALVLRRRQHLLRYPEGRPLIG